MRRNPIVYLMYHEIEVGGRPLCQQEQGYVRYVLRESEFRAQMEYLKNRGYRGLSVGQALNTSDEKAVAITFDDGSETDLLFAAPMLRDACYGATFYLTAGWIGKPGFLSPAQVQELTAQGFEIGCHSMTHAYLIDLDDEGLRREIADAKQKLEEITGSPVIHFSCPGGRYDERVVRTAKAAGYKTVANSSIRVNTPETDPFDLGRVAMMRDLLLNDFEEICTGAALPRMRAQGSVRNAVKQLLGNSLYDKVRGVLLGDHTPAH